MLETGSSRPPPPAVRLSAGERAQLGQPKPLKNGKQSSYRFVPKDRWDEVRALLLARSKKSNPSLDPALTAYTPGETRALLSHPEIRAWHARMRAFDIPPEFDTVAFVPCAKTKPWDGLRSGSLYGAYNAIRDRVQASDAPKVFFVTLSEPLGVVPETHWGDFPQYDNPGLFRCDAQRSGLFTGDWLEGPFGEKLIIPFDDAAYRASIDALAQVISDFAARNAEGRRFVSFVEPLSGPPGTHSEMLDRAAAILGRPIVAPADRHPKSDRPRHKMPVDWMIERLERRCPRTTCGGSPPIRAGA